jgi:hypothetical protein
MRDCSSLDQRIRYRVGQTVPVETESAVSHGMTCHSWMTFTWSRGVRSAWASNPLIGGLPVCRPRHRPHECDDAAQKNEPKADVI